MTDEFSTIRPRLEAPAGRHYTVTPSDTVDLPERPRALYVNGDGNAVVELEGTVITYTGLTTGMILPLRATRVHATSTTATLVAWV